MSLIYVVTLDTFNEGDSIRNAYIIAKGPFDDKKEAKREAKESLLSLYERYKVLETEEKEIKWASISDNETLIYIRTIGEIIPIARYSVIEIDMDAVTACKKSRLMTAFKTGTAEQSLLRQKVIKSNQYIATLTPNKLNLSKIIAKELQE